MSAYLGGDIMSFVNNLRVAYKLLILCVIGAIGMAILGYSGYSAL